ncbi:N-formylglutamate amidohydrolase [Salegentibacter sp. F14]
MKLVLTCEHASNLIPKEYRYLFLKADVILNSHRGYDPGAFDLFEHLQALGDFSLAQHISRLLVEVNRSLGHPDLFSEFTKDLSQGEKNKIISQWYTPYRIELENEIKNLLGLNQQVIHLSTHSFTPVFKGQTRNLDIGLLYDPGRDHEKRFCKVLKLNLNSIEPSWKIRFNYPYRGKADGLTTYLRRKFKRDYFGIELEVNQKFVCNNRMDQKLKEAIFTALDRSLY